MLTKSSTELVRQRNSVLVLAALRRHGALAHTEIADFTKLSSATISAITADLEKAQIIEKSEQQPSRGRGRPRVLFRQRRDCGYLVVVIISSDGVQYSLVDYAGKLIDRFSEERSHDPAGAERFIASIKQGLARILSRSKLPQERVLLISISSKGLVHPTDPVLVWSPIFGSNQIDFESALRPDWQARIFLGNETQLVAAALGAHEANARPVDFRSLAALSLGHSVGLGIVRSTGPGEREVSAPNFGHMLHMANGGLCRCHSPPCCGADRTPGPSWTCWRGDWSVAPASTIRRTMPASSATSSEMSRKPGGLTVTSAMPGSARRRSASRRASTCGSSAPMVRATGVDQWAVPWAVRRNWMRGSPVLPRSPSAPLIRADSPAEFTWPAYRRPRAPPPRPAPPRPAPAPRRRGSAARGGGQRGPHAGAGRRPPWSSAG